MTSTSTVRLATLGDAARIAMVGRASFTWAFAHLFRPEVLSRYLEHTYSEQKIASSISKPQNTYFVAEPDGQVCAFLKLKRDNFHPTLAGRPQWQVQKLYVEPTLIQRGLGKSLMVAGDALMRREGAACSWLEMYKGNMRALRFYSDLGYAEIGSTCHHFEDIRIDFKVLAKADEEPEMPNEPRQYDLRAHCQMRHSHR